MKRIHLAVAMSLFAVGTAEAQPIALKPSEVLKQIFSASQEVVADKRTLTPDQKACAEKLLGERIARTDWTFQVAKANQKIDGYAVIDNEIGKTEPITFLTVITPEGRVQEVEILAYREPYGGEIQDKRYLKQYGGKAASDPLRVGGDISNISGATISSRSVALGVKRDLVVWSCVYGN